MALIQSWPHRVWQKIQEPRAVSIIYFFAYLLIAIAGLAALLDPPTGIIAGIGRGMLHYWAGTLVLGGVLGAASTPTGIWWVERAATAFCMTGIVIYAAVVVTLPAPQASQRVISMCFIGFALLMFSVRLVKIRRYAYDPEK